MLKAGEYLIKPTLNTTTYDPNLATNVEFTTICCENQVKAASNTIPMQPTGMPLVALVLAVLLVGLGFVKPKK
jgi:hypothetical protein